MFIEKRLQYRTNLEKASILLITVLIKMPKTLKLCNLWQQLHLCRLICYCL